jgi:hypothetical protein
MFDDSLLERFKCALVNRLSPPSKRNKANRRKTIGFNRQGNPLPDTRQEAGINYIKYRLSRPDCR